MAEAPEHHTMHLSVESLNNYSSRDGAWQVLNIFDRFGGHLRS
jgi:hypothetical protein